MARRFVSLAFALLLAHGSAHAVVNGTLVGSRDPIARSAVMLACIEERPGSSRIVASASGVIVGPQLVLTAAHILSMCKPGASAAGDAQLRWELKFGPDAGAASTPAVAIDPADFGNEDPSRLMSPLNVDHGTYRDYAFLRVPGGIPRGMRPMRIAADPAAVAKGTPVFFSGYGYTSQRGTDHRLRTARLTLTSVDAASPRMPPLDPHLNAWDREHYLDFYASSQHACLGDSGGPFYVVEGGEPVLVAMLTHIQTIPGRRIFCDVPAIGMRIDAVAAELQRINARLGSATAR
jgi:hypothetical protein